MIPSFHSRTNPLHRSNIAFQVEKEGSFQLLEAQEYPIRAHFTDQKGMHLVSTRPIHEGEIILKECPITLAIESKYRRQYCGICADSLSKEAVKEWLADATINNDPQSILCELCASNGYVRRLNNFFKNTKIQFNTEKPRGAKAKSDSSINHSHQDVNLYQMFFRLFLDYAGCRSNAIDDDVLFLESTALAMLAYDPFAASKEVIHDIESISEIIHRLLCSDPQSPLAKMNLTVDDIQIACHTMICNQHAITDSELKEEIGRAVCPIAALLNHSCDANVCWELSSKTQGIMICKATRDIQAGEELTISYYNPAMLSQISGHHERKAYLMRQRQFMCACSLCKNVCNGCGQTGCKALCAKCKQVWYCGADCQRKDWTDRHKEDCKLLRIPPLHFP